MVACYAQVADYINLTEIGRWISLRYQLQSDPLRLWLALVPGGGRAIEAINSTSLQKFNVRQMQAMSAKVGGAANKWTKAKGKQPAGNIDMDVDAEEDDDDADAEEGRIGDSFKPTKYNPLFMLAHGMMMLTSRSYQSAISKLCIYPCFRLTELIDVLCSLQSTSYELIN